MEKHYVINDCQVKVVFEEGLIRITNDKALKRAAQRDPQESVDLLIKQINEDYYSYQGKALAVTSDSLAVEIWGHIYIEYFLLKYKKLLRVILVFGLYTRFRRSCEVIDCGEHGKDPNRGLWDMLAPHRGRIAERLPKVDLLRFTVR